MRVSQRFSVSLLLALAAVAAHAEGTLQPVPTPDTSRMAPDAAKKLADERAVIDKAKINLVGPPLAQAYADLGALYARNGFDEAAAVAFYDATQANPSDGRWFYLRGVIARKLKRNEDARANFQAALERDRVYLPIRYRLADTLVDLGDTTAARKLLEDTAREHADVPVVFAMLGQLALKQKRYADAVDAINKALKLDPQATGLYAYLADAYAGQNNARAADEARAKAGRGMAAMDDPLVAGMLAPPQEAGTTLAEARSLAQQGNIQGARDTLAAVLKKTPDDVEALAFGARIEATFGNQAVAQAYVDQALKAKSDSASARVASGIVAEYAGDDAKAYDEYRQAQRLDRKLPDSWLLLGNAEMRRARYAQAAEQYRGLIALQPDSATAYAHLVAALTVQGKCDAALQAINSVLERRKNDGDLLQIFVRVASTCADADAKMRDVALEHGQALYKQRPDAANAAALALALAAHGKFKDAQEYQAQAIFEATRARNTEAAALLRSTMQQFVKQQVPDRPWPAGHPYFKAPLLAAPPPAAAASAAAKTGN
ncbi:MAG: tetratricopeptide repeat protein [Proteobacteria bacterium]|uniref:tetratricopeptide repeat protein n=1 Tax=Rudaea sp. TaxID=2136325 RepID=UPI0032205A58|nr:tetratricopeptide repeat protein [Pseudomonadota bacterium]